MASVRLVELKAQLAILRTHLIPVELSPTNEYGATQDHVETTSLAYRIMAHAEIEAYIEDRVLEVLAAARRAWEESGHVSRPLLALLAFSGDSTSKPPESLLPANDNQKKNWPLLLDIGEKLRPVLAKFYKHVRLENHGIKEKDLLALLLPIGIEHSKLDPQFLISMNEFGTQRGAGAHQSRSAARQAASPAAEIDRITNVLTGLEILDALINELLAQATPPIPTNP
jgi:hypothetical protein